MRQDLAQAQAEKLKERHKQGSWGHIINQLKKLLLTTAMFSWKKQKTHKSWHRRHLICTKQRMGSMKLNKRTFRNYLVIHGKTIKCNWLPNNWKLMSPALQNKSISYPVYITGWDILLAMPTLLAFDWLLHPVLLTACLLLHKQIIEHCDFSMLKKWGS